MVCKTTPSTIQKSDKKLNPLLNVKTFVSPRDFFNV